MLLVSAYAVLFLISFVAGTCLPFLPASSEISMAAFLASGKGAAWAVLLIAVAGNVAGAGLNYFVGRGIAHVAANRRFVSAGATARAQDWFRSYGTWALAMCWVPAFGDAITIVAGALRTDPRTFLALVTGGKLFGHSLVALGVVSLAGSV
ncbi:MAG: YqaA family protein [Parvibaculaceae bacterium]